MTIDRTVREELLEKALLSYRDQHETLTKTWTHLDSKAQGSIAVSGTFLAAAFAFVNLWESSTPTPLDKYVLCVVIITLVFSVVIALYTLRVREVLAAPFGETLHDLVGDMDALSDREIEARQSPFISDQIALWETVNRDVAKVNKEKARCIFWSQLFLVLAIVLVAILSARTIL